MIGEIISGLHNRLALVKRISILYFDFHYFPHQYSLVPGCTATKGYIESGIFPPEKPFEAATHRK